ncbi:tetratricopeptide repeat protein [Gemmobacter serpentinus]|uniref:tetratricopeptide repeat protein n=1 Tax=Gemmobacter serpentinus TaxID=2652247 RepID=UPI00124F1C6D|nr:hypothetical protein [Gemmobacter serpentinus]
MTDGLPPGLRASPRRVHGPFGRALIAGGLIAGLMTGGFSLGAAVADEVEIDLTSARSLAIQAVQSGDMGAAITIAQRLIARDPKDALAQQILATAALNTGELDTARVAVRRAYGAAQTDRQRHEAAKLAAIIAAEQGRGLALRYWLRQAGENSPTQQERALAVSALNTVRDASPWETRLRFSVSPSDNVNGGSDRPYNVIDGRPEVGMLDGDARALSGVEARLGVDTSYMLNRSARAQTRLTFDLDLQRTRLSDSARKQAVTLSGSDFARSAIGLGVEHLRADASGRGAWSYGATLGLSDDSNDTGRSLSLSVDRIQRLSESTRLSFGAEWTLDETVSGTDALQRIPRLWMGLSQRLENGASLGLSISAYEVQSPSGQRARHGGVAQVSYTPASSIGPFDLSGALGAGVTRYPDYRVGFIAPDGGRQDSSVFGQVSVGFKEVSWAGFAPEMTLRISRTDSNISRFDSTETGILFGLKSQF